MLSQQKLWAWYGLWAGPCNVMNFWTAASVSMPSPSAFTLLVFGLGLQACITTSCPLHCLHWGLCCTQWNPVHAGCMNLRTPGIPGMNCAMPWLKLVAKVCFFHWFCRWNCQTWFVTHIVRMLGWRWPIGVMTFLLLLRGLLCSDWKVPLPLPYRMPPGILRPRHLVLSLKSVLLKHMGSQKAQQEGKLAMGHVAFLRKQFKETGIAVLALQEARSGGAVCRHNADFLVFQSGATASGTHGIEVWISRTLPYAFLGSKPLFHTADHFHVLAFDPRYLVIEVVCSVLSMLYCGCSCAFCVFASWS